MSNTDKNILVVDDEPKILEVVTAILENNGFKVLVAENGMKALEIFNTGKITLVVLDLMLPDISGEDVCRSIRSKSNIPIIMLTAKAGENDFLEGLRLGADDYITKPFSLRELHARIIAVLRRTESDSIYFVGENSFNKGDLVVDLEKKTVKKRLAAVTLTYSEFKLLSSLVKYPGKVFTREELIEIALDEDFRGCDRSIDSHIKNIRQKIEDDPKNPTYILTLYGYGYKFGGTCS
jgi:DNA-binding response OmpR family regulator